MPQQIKIETNLETLAEDIGRYLGMAEGIQQKSYMDGIMSKAYGDALLDFHKAAAASAKSHNFTHMYEYGTVGITRGPKKHLDPTARKARLWIDQLYGKGGRKVISFIFRDALTQNPPHTPEETGVAQEELDQLAVNQGKKYFFRSRAYVFESGTDVNIYPKDAKVLFVPLGPSGITAGGAANERGFVFAKHLRMNPGEQTDSVGQFTTFFFEWWNTIGSQLMATSMNTQVQKHIREEERKVQKSGKLKPPRNTNIAGASASQKAKTRKQFEIKALREAGWEDKIL